MRARPILGVAVLCICVGGGLAVRAATSQQDANAAVVALLNQANQAVKELRFDDAEKRVDEAMAMAQKIGDPLGLAMSYRMKGAVLRQTVKSAEAMTWYQRAVNEFEKLGNQAGVADALSGVVALRIQNGDTKGLRELAERAMKLYEAVGNDRGRAIVLSGLIRSGVEPSMSDAWLQELLQIAARVSDDGLMGEALVLRAGKEFGRGDYAAAKISFEQAIAANQRAGDIEDVAAAYLSLGRVFRAHGDYEGAIQRYQKAIDLLAPTKERYTIVEATNAKAIALGYLGRQAESLAAYEQGLALARESGTQRVIDFMEGNLAGALLNDQKYERAIEILRAVIARKPDRNMLAYRQGALARALFSTGHLDEALTSINEAVLIGREFKQADNLRSWLDTRGQILKKLKQYDQALTDQRESMDIVEQIRSRVVPSDFLKRGYADHVQYVYANMVELLSLLSRPSEALEAVEQGRARAFLDLLARQDSADSLTTRGSELTSAGTADLASTGLGRPLPAAGIQTVAARLKSGILTYWINDDATLIWLVRPGASTLHVRVPVGSKKLGELVAATTAALRASSAATTTRGADSVEPVPGTDDDVAALPMRGLGLLALSRDDKSAWRELYKTLIEPVRTQLPARGSRLTIVPHGPLFQLSFAALQSANGRYLIEDYQLSYAPAISVLEFTGRRQQEVAGNKGPWAIVGNPRALPSVGARPLPALPGAEREIATIAAIAPKGSALRLEGAGADETALGRTLDSAQPSVLHFATHGFVFDDPKQPPFLALNRRSDKATEDGRLTLEEVYGLKLNTDLVVLSACRSGSGKISTDGVLGLTRGFFYAGTPSVLATFWDVVDESTERLISGFYRQYVKTHAKGASLRSAQLALLADLRAGKVIVTAGGRRITLPEHPLLWAAFFLSGEP